MESWVQHNTNINPRFPWRFVGCRLRLHHNGEQDRENDFTDFFCGWGSVLSLSTVLSAHTRQTSWTPGVRRARARYRLSSVSAPLVYLHQRPLQFLYFQPGVRWGSWAPTESPSCSLQFWCPVSYNQTVTIFLPLKLFTTRRNLSPLMEHTGFSSRH